MKRFLRATSLEELSPLRDGGWDGLVFGTEFCANLLPSPEAVKEARTAAANAGVSFTLATPITVESAFDRVAGWLRQVLLPADEWVANDLGLMRLAKREGLGGALWAGRLLSRQQRGQGIATLLENADEPRRRHLTGSLWDDPATVELFRPLGVVGFELDAVKWGFVRPANLEGFELAVAGPWCAVTWSPWCFFAQDGACPCRPGNIAMLTLESEREGAPHYTLGNTVFTRTEESRALQVAAETKADRLVWSPKIPG